MVIHEYDAVIYIYETSSLMEELTRRAATLDPRHSTYNSTMDIETTTTAESS
jgi:hypothetical protein